MKCPQCQTEITMKDMTHPVVVRGTYQDLIKIEALCPACSYLGIALFRVNDFNRDDDWDQNDFEWREG